MKEISARVPTSDIASADAWILRFLGQYQRMKRLVHGLSIW
jgi:hypothetical protein